MATMYELSAQYREYFDAIPGCANNAELDTLLQEIFKLDGDITEKAEQYARIIKNLKSDASGYDTEIKRLQRLKKASENAVERMTVYLHVSMQTALKTSISTSIGKWTISTNPPSVEVIDEGLIPDEFWKAQEPQLDKNSIIEAYKDGITIPGANVVQKEGLRFR